MGNYWRRAMSTGFELNRGYNIHPRGVDAFSDYFVGISSLASVATKNDRVCVLNILGGESRSVTPTSHAYSGGNVVCGTQPGRSGSKLKTTGGDIPVYNNVVEALGAGHRFNTAVVYVPPAGVKDAVIEAVRVNPEILKVVIVTEKVPLRDARIIRSYCQQRGVDVFGANCLGVADAHNKVRIGGALGGSKPEESLVPGSVAVYSNSGNFTTTIAVYLLTRGWGTTTSVSSGKDVYIHYAAPEFVHAFHNDARSKAAVIYIEPGGYYEADINFHKPVVACVVGRWKAKLTRACGHAGAIAGSGDSAESKERWFMDKFGVDDIYTPENPVYSARGAVVTNIAHVPEALTAVMEANGAKSDFAPKGDLSLKCWFTNDQGILLPEELAIPVVEAVQPYGEHIDILNEQVGLIQPRQTLKDASGATMMDPKSQVTRIHGVSVLDSTAKSFEENLVHALLRSYPDESGREMTNVVLNAYVNQVYSQGLLAADAARKSGNSPNTALAAAVAGVGPDMLKPAQSAIRTLVELFKDTVLRNPGETGFDFSTQFKAALKGKAAEDLVTKDEANLGQTMLDAMAARGVQSVFIDFLNAWAEETGHAISAHAVMGAVACHLAWNGLMYKRLSLNSLYNLPWHLRVFSVLIGASVEKDRQGEEHFCGVSTSELLGEWSFTETAYLALLDARPTTEELFTLQIILGMVISNGPGTISAQGAKGAVSADGPEAPGRVQINKGYIGFLSHTGYAHGGNGYEAMTFLMERFREVGLVDPGAEDHGLDLAQMALDYAKEYKKYKVRAKAEGELSYWKIPCISHPVFKGKKVNHDPREVFVNNLLSQRGQYNAFLEFYHELVEALFKTGVSNNVYCVNVDAVIAVLLLKMLWKPYQDGEISEKALENAAFTVFLFGRMIGSSAEIDDHINRGRNMDTRTPSSKCRFVG